MDCSKEVIMRALTDAIRNCNRNIYEWLEKSKRGSRFTISHTEIRGLVKNWIIRCVKDTVGSMQADRILREGNLCVSVDDTNNCIGHISLSTSDAWRKIQGDIDLFKKCMSEIDYKSLRYNPSDYITNTKQPIDYHYGNPANIDLSSIEKVTF